MKPATLPVLPDVKADLLVFLQRFEAFRLNLGEVRKQVLAAVVLRDKSKAFHIAKPIHGTGWHAIALLSN
jgi:hypothetical protein